METIDQRGARRLALARAGLLAPRWSGLPARAQGNGKRALKGALAVIRRFGYLQLDTVSVAGARSHGLVLLSRLEGFDPALAERLLRPGVPLFEYWGHEASWLPIESYPLFWWRREAFKAHPWWGDLLVQHPREAKAILKRIESEGPLRAVDLTEASGAGWWQLGTGKKLLSALWSAGLLAVRERREFHRCYDLTERVIPLAHRTESLGVAEALPVLLERALAGHGWATTATIAQTWRLRKMRPAIDEALALLVAEGQVIRCALQSEGTGSTPGWVRPRDLAVVDDLRRMRPRTDRGVLLSPFDPVLWDRARVARLFGFEQILEIFKPASQRRYGYYCLPVLAGDRLVARVDLKAQRRQGQLRLLSFHFEPGPRNYERAIGHALARLASSLSLRLVGASAFVKEVADGVLADSC